MSSHDAAAVVVALGSDESFGGLAQSQSSPFPRGRGLMFVDADPTTTTTTTTTTSTSAPTTTTTTPSSSAAPTTATTTTTIDGTEVGASGLLARQTRRAPAATTADVAATTTTTTTTTTTNARLSPTLVAWTRDDSAATTTSSPRSSSSPSLLDSNDTGNRSHRTSTAAAAAAAAAANHAPSNSTPGAAASCPPFAEQPPVAFTTRLRNDYAPTVAAVVLGRALFGEKRMRATLGVYFAVVALRALRAAPHRFDNLIVDTTPASVTVFHKYTAYCVADTLAFLLEGAGVPVGSCAPWSSRARAHWRVQWDMVTHHAVTLVPSVIACRAGMGHALGLMDLVSEVMPSMTFVLGALKRRIVARKRVLVAAGVPSSRPPPSYAALRAAHMALSLARWLLVVVYRLPLYARSVHFALCRTPRSLALRPHVFFGAVFAPLVMAYLDLGWLRPMSVQTLKSFGLKHAAAALRGESKRA